MTQPARVRVDLDLELPADLARLVLPEAVDRRLQSLLDKQDAGHSLTDEERLEAEGLVDLAEILSLLRLRATRSELSNDFPGRGQDGGTTIRIRRSPVRIGRGALVRRGCR